MPPCGGVVPALLRSHSARRSGGSSWVAKSLLSALRLSSCEVRVCSRYAASVSLSRSLKLVALHSCTSHSSTCSSPKRSRTSNHREACWATYGHPKWTFSGNQALISLIRVSARLLIRRKLPPKRCGVAWSSQNCNRTAIHDHRAGDQTRMSLYWAPRGANGSSPRTGIVLCANSNVRSHLGMEGTGKGSSSCQCCMPHSMMARISAANLRAWSPKAERLRSAS